MWISDIGILFPHHWVVFKPNSAIIRPLGPKTPRPGKVPPSPPGGLEEIWNFNLGQRQSIPIGLEMIHAKFRENWLIRYENCFWGGVVPPRGECGGKMNFGQRESIPTYSSTIQSKFHWNRTIFSKKHFYEKIVRYPGRLGGGRRGLAPPHRNCSSWNADSYAICRIFSKINGYFLS